MDLPGGAGRGVRAAARCALNPRGSGDSGAKLARVWERRERWSSCWITEMPSPSRRRSRRPPPSVPRAGALRRQIASLERQLSDAFLTAFSMREFDLHRRGAGFRAAAARPRRARAGAR